MDHKKLNRLIGLGVSLVTLAAYIKTLSPTVVFWDVGEFCAAAFSLQVPHPPGAPLFLLLAHISSMIPLIPDIAVRMHIVSAIGSAITCGLLYFIIVDMITMWKGIPRTGFERIALFGPAIIGAFSLAFTNTFWFNAVEAEVYGLSMTFVGLIILLGLRWYEHAHTESGDRTILIIAYIVGLSIGVHLLAVLALFPVMLLWYFRYHAFDWRSFIKFCIGAILVFGMIYPGVVTILPSLLDGEVKFGGTQIKNPLISYIPLLLILGAIYGIYYSIRKKKRLMNVALLSFLFIILGYSTYTLVYIRANAHPPMNENDPSTLSKLVSYLNREQYGSPPNPFIRRWDEDPVKKRYHQNYTSDFGYLWRYQVKHMYLRYFGWNYIGSQGDFRDAGVDWKKYYLIPFLFGILGAYYQWRKQPSLGFTMIVTFIMMGVILALYQNQQEPQPRERDYFYVGSFFVFSLWIAYGVVALIDFMKKTTASEQTAGIMGFGALAFAFIFVPLNMFISNYHQANRAGNYVAWDYSYNMLQSCEKDAILITNGDNDTFPLWYLQDVEGIRRDIRIVNLSLVNTPWYIKQLKHETPYGAKKVPLSTSDVDIESIKPIRFEPRWMELPVSADIIQKYQVEGNHSTSLTDTSLGRIGAIRFLMPNTLQFGTIKAIRAQDIMMFDMIMTNNWQRPIYYAMTVSDDGKIGLRDYLQMTGLALRLTPFKSKNYWSNLNDPVLHQNIFTNIHNFSKDPQYGFLWRGLQDSRTYYDEDTRALLTSNYRNMFISYALYCANIKNKPEEAPAILDRMEEVLPRHSIPMDYRIKHDVASIYNIAGRKDHYLLLMNELMHELSQMISQPITEPLSQYNPYIVLFQCYEELHMYQEADDVLPLIKSVYAQEPEIDRIVQQLHAQIQMKQAARLAEQEQQTKPK
jgi:hypothetical protein